MIELGIRLRNFMGYFNNKRDSAFAHPLQGLLESGIHFKCYVLDPNGNFGERYFRDRSLVQFQEKAAMKESPAIIEKLQREFRQLNAQHYPGQLELYLYDHFPYYHATVIDGATEQGQNR